MELRDDGLRLLVACRRRRRDRLLRPCRRAHLRGQGRRDEVGCRDEQLRVPASPTSRKDADDVDVGSNARALVAISREGRRLWQFDTKGGISATPLVLTNGAIVVGSDDASLYAVRPDGSPRRRDQDQRAGAVVGCGRARRDDLLRLRTTDASTRRRATAGSAGPIRPTRRCSRRPRSLSTAPSSSARRTGTSTRSGRTASSAIATRRARRCRASPALAADGTAFVGSDDETVYAIGLDGKLRWQFKIGGVAFSSPAIAPDGTVYIGTGDGRLYAFR